MFKVPVRGSYVYLHGGIIVDVQIFKDLKLPKELQFVIRGASPWVSADEYQDLLGHDDTRAFALYSAYLSKERLVGECPLGAMARRFNFKHSARGCDSTTQLDFTAKLHCLINELGDLHPTVAPSDSVPLDSIPTWVQTRVLRWTDAEYTDLLEKAWDYAHDARKLKKPIGQGVRDAHHMANMVIGERAEYQWPVMTPSMLATMRKHLGSEVSEDEEEGVDVIRGGRI